MVDYPEMTALRGMSLTDAPQHVADVLRLDLPPADQFQAGTVQLAGYEFAANALSGMAAAMRTPTGTATRATTTVAVPLTDDTGRSTEVQREVTLYGPGDVIGVDPAQIIRRYPSPGSLTAEETFHAHIEFDRPELPWAFSAETAGPTMRPWLTLVVLQRDEVSWEPITAGTAAVMSVDSALLPRVEDAWAMAHAQASAGTAALSVRLSTAYAPVNLSRLLGARVLTQNTAYVAALVPTTDVGVRAGLGLDGGSLGPGWRPGTGPVRLPVYDRWEFSTAPDGDFARLARRLTGVAAPWRIGRRIMDTSRPGLPLTDLVPDEPGRRQVIRCALFSPNAAPPQAPADDAAWSTPRTEDLRAALDRPAVVEGRSPTDPGRPPDLPIIGPRIYAQYQRGSQRIIGSDWFAELNLAPADRVVAGLGTRVVGKDQESLMQAAWAQVGEIDKANRALAIAQIAQAVGARLHSRLTRLDPARVLAMTRPVAPRVRLDGAPLTVLGQLEGSSTAPQVVGGAVRRATRPAGRLAQRVEPTQRAALAGIASPDGVARDLQRPLGTLDGIAGLSALALESLTNRDSAAALGIPVQALSDTLDRAGRLLAAGTTLAGATTIVEAQGNADPSYVPADAAAARMQQRILAGARHLDPDDLAGQRWYAGLAAGLAGALGERDRARQPLIDLATSTQDLLVRATAERPGRPVGPVGVGRTDRIEPVGPDRVVHGSLVRRGAARATGPTRAAGMTLRAAVRDSTLLTTTANSLVGNYLPRVPTRGTRLTTAEKLADIVTPAGRALGTGLAGTGPRVEAIATAVVDLVRAAGVLELATTPVRPALAVGPLALSERLDPRRTVVDAIRGRLSVELAGTSDWLVGHQIRPIMAAPHFDRAMYQALDDYDRNWLVPGLGLLPVAEMVTVLEANDRFTEAFLIGLSDEMGRELLWRGYPTDQRGTYFRRFWDSSKDELAEQLHRFRATELGSHLGSTAAGRSGRAVVVVRGEIVRRYPDLTVMALKGQPGPGGAMTDDAGRPFLPETPTGPEHAAASLFTAFLTPDVMLAGLDITTDALRSGGWWIVLAEHPQAARFRRSEPDLVGREARFARVGGYPHGAAAAADRLENPTRIAFEAGDFLPAP